MKLPIPQFGKKKPTSEYFLALILRDEYISAWILEEHLGSLRVAGKSEESLTSSIEQQSPEKWLEILDRVISKAEETIPKNVVTHKTMFGVKESWVEDTHIKKDYLSKMKTICDTLALQPVGFVVISEAIAHQLQEQEGAPLTAILVEIGKQQITISYLRAGKIIETRHSMIVNSPTDTVDALLKYFTTATVLPARLVIYDGVNTDQLAQDFIVHQWSKSLPFLHMPQITALPKGFDVKAVIKGAAEQMGLRVSGEIIMGQALPISTQTQEMTNDQLPMTNDGARKTLAQQFNQTYIEHEAPKEGETTPEVDEPQLTMTTDNFGFVEEQDVADKVVETVPEVAIPTQAIQQDNFENFSPDFQPQVEPQESHEARPLPAGRQGNPFNMLLAKVTVIKKFVPHFSVPSGNRIPRWLYVLPVILIVIVGSIVWYFLQVKATVDITLKPKIVEEQGSVTFATGSGNDFSTNTLAAKDQSVSLDGSATGNATGSKDIGSPAKGTVTVYNISNSPQNFPSGTTITASTNNLVYTLDSAVTVASGSGDASSPQPGTATVNITAKDIGSTYNLPSGVTFSISNTDKAQIDAKNSAALSGGTKKTVTVVSQKDLDTLVKSLPNSLQDQAKQQLHGNVSGDEVLLPDIISTDISSKTYDHKVNDQASSVTLKATVVFHSISYNKNDMQDLEKSLLKNKFSDNTSLSDQGITNTISNIKTNDNKTVTADIRFKAGLLPKLDTKQLLTQITGKTITEAKSFLMTQPQVESSEIQLSPNIPLIPQVLPKFSNHITITMHSDG